MVDIRPFAGLRYDPTRATIGDAPNNQIIADLIAPPYDVIDATQRRALCDLNPYNIVRLELPEGQDRYAEAARRLHKWVAAGVLRQDERPAFYIYDEEFQPQTGPKLSRRAIFAAVRLYDWADDVIMAHEGTMTGPKADRLALLEATRVNLSPIYVLYEDADGAVNAILSHAATDQHTQGARSVDADDQPHRQWTVGKTVTGFEFEDEHGNLNRFVPVDDPQAIAALQQAFGDKRLYIADGHHRYETALTYRNQQRAAGGGAAAEFVMLALTATNDPGLRVLPTHRVVTGLTADARATLDGHLADHFTIEHVPMGDDPGSTISRIMMEQKDGHIFGAYGLLPGSVSLLRLTDPIVMDGVTDHSAAWRALDVAVLQKVVLEDGLGMTEATLAAAQGIVYVKDKADAVAMVDVGAAGVAFFLQPTRVEEVLAVADAHDRMPRKSTYFYPKLPTGLVLRALDTLPNH